MIFRHVIYLFIYIGCGSLFTLLVKNSQSVDANGKNQYKYEPVAITACVELFKLIATTVFILFFNDSQMTVSAKLTQLYNKRGVAKLFAIPAFLYFLFNALAFFNLNLVQPSTYRLLINLKVLFSGIMLQLIIGTKLTVRQWIALVLLVLACGIEQIDSFDYNTGLFAVLLICVQALCSSSAGVYFQLLLQKGNNPEAAELGLWEKNFFMYLWSVLFNIVYLALFSRQTLLEPAKAVGTFDMNVIPIILASGIGGFSTSLILRDLDVIVKEYANFAEMCVVVLGSFLFLNTQLHMTLLVAVGIVTYSLYLYNIPSSSTPIPSTTNLSTRSDTEAVRLDVLLSGRDVTRIPEPTTDVEDGDTLVQRPLLASRS